MSVEQFVTIIGALTALIVAVTAALVQLRQTHELVNSRMTELLEVTRGAARAEGKLDAESHKTRGETPHSPN